MPDDRMSPIEELKANRLIELFLRLVSTDDVRQLVLEMEEELAKPVHLSLVRAEKVATFTETSKETVRSASAADAIDRRTIEFTADTNFVNGEEAGAPRPTAQPS
jgi:hypothetical protein